MAGGCICGGASSPRATQGGAAEGRPTGAAAGGMGGRRGIDGLERCHPIIGQLLPLGCVLPGGSSQPAGGTTLQLPSLSRRADAGHPHRSHTASAISDRPASQRPFHTDSHASGQWRRSACRSRDPSQEPLWTPSDPQCRPGAVSSARLRRLCVSTAAIYPVGPG